LYAEQHSQLDTALSTQTTNVSRWKCLTPSIDLCAKEQLFAEIIETVATILPIADVPELIANYLPIAAALKQVL
jgi:hypothetical protein